MYKLDGKTALVTGAATGIGRRIATRLAEEGADIAIFDVNMTDAEETAKMVRQIGRRCEVTKVDVADFNSVDQAVAGVIKSFGKIDILVNNAGIICLGTVVDTPVEQWRKVFQVNVDGVFHCCKAALPHMLLRGNGKVINTASWFGKIGKPEYSAYCASKFAVIGLTQSLAMEVAAKGINVNAVCPGTIVETNMRIEADKESIRRGIATAKEREKNIPMGRVGLPEDIARAVAFLASDEAAYMTGQSINVTGGLWMH